MKRGDGRILYKNDEFTAMRCILSTSEEYATQNTVVISVTMTTGLFYIHG
jgi:hypothetical protein